jgi:hypothetical protein
MSEQLNFQQLTMLIAAILAAPGDSGDEKVVVARYKKILAEMREQRPEADSRGKIK